MFVALINTANNAVISVDKIIYCDTLHGCDIKFNKQPTTY